MAIGIAGAGRVAQALGRALHERGVTVAWIASRDRRHAEAAARFIGSEAISYEQLGQRAERILIAVSDNALTCVARILADSGMKRGEALHSCGSRGADALAALARQGVSCGTLHPLQTIASPEQGVASLPGSTFAISGDAEAVAWAGDIVRLLEGHALRIRPDRAAIYHAAAVMASNYGTALIGAAVELMGASGIGEKEALMALGPLVRTSAENALTLGPRLALSGPIQRGDSATVRRHLEALRGASEETQALYRAAGRQALRLTEHPSLEIEELLNG